jgi:hypothetical protein
MLRLGYGHLDTVAAWMADDYFDLDPLQKDDFARRFARLHEWHRYEQLPEYAAFLRDMRSRVERGLQREDIVWLREGIRQRYRTFVRQAAPDAAALLLTISPQQLEALQRQFDKDNRKFAREHHLEGTPQERLRANVERAVDQLKTWVGALNHEQEERIAALVATLPPIDPLRHQDRQRRQQEFLQLMRQRGNPTEFRDRLQRWLMDWERGRAPEYERMLAEWWDKRMAHIVALDRMFTPQQRAHALRRLQRYSDDFLQLAERRRTEAALQPIPERQVGRVE